MRRPGVSAWTHGRIVTMRDHDRAEGRTSGDSATLPAHAPPDQLMPRERWFAGVAGPFRCRLVHYSLSSGFLWRSSPAFRRRRTTPTGIWLPGEPCRRRARDADRRVLAHETSARRGSNYEWLSQVLFYNVYRVAACRC